MGQPLRNVYPYVTRYQVFKYRLARAIRWTLIRVGIIATALALLSIGYIVGQLDQNEVHASSGTTIADVLTDNLPRS